MLLNIGSPVSMLDISAIGWITCEGLVKMAQLDGSLNSNLRKRRHIFIAIYIITRLPARIKIPIAYYGNEPIRARVSVHWPSMII